MRHDIPRRFSHCNKIASKFTDYKFAKLFLVAYKRERMSVR